MRVALLNTKDTLRARYILECFGAGVQVHGDTFVWVDDYKRYREQLEGSDLGVQVCFPNKKAAKTDGQGRFRIDVNEHLFKRGRRVVTIDTGHILDQSAWELKDRLDNGAGRVLFDLDNKDTYKAVLKEIYYQVGFDGLKNNADYCVGADCPDTRWKKLEAKGIELKPWREKGDHILLIGQTVNGLSSQKIDIYRYYADAVRAIREVTERPILFRHHPRISKIREHGSRISKDVAALDQALRGVKNFGRSDPDKCILAADLENAWAAVAYSSNASVGAILAGIPLFAGDKINMAWDVACHDLKRIEKPKLHDRANWANRMAFAQWTCAEMINGECWAHLRPHALETPKPAYEWR